ncbi:aspartyl aminopeptidase [Actinobaculum suis]|uniref:M18 family aminopeptidase n=1 Tax=Actinobaculum suis TaxID=1657 RepID=A0A1G7DQI5_9ACTO|nr:M18 family aminopeptidase [Actinobaculum suis]MDY5153558.1 M18 family aminopeptidase [Actinobaculum suis]SDE53748.1 aspartyl aminopeptidase [Actinobaculum suis]
MENAKAEAFRVAVKENATSLARFITASPTSYHAAAEIAQALRAAGFRQETETETWSGAPGGHFIVRGGGVLAWWIPEQKVRGYRIVGSHTDSPSLKLKPNEASQHFGFTQVDMEVYGGPLLGSWLNRDLGLAGRVTDYAGQTHLVATGPCMVIPQIAPHLDRSASTKLDLDPQRHLHPILTVPLPDNTEDTASTSTATGNNAGNGNGAATGVGAATGAGAATGGETGRAAAQYPLRPLLAAASGGAVRAGDIAWHDIYAYTVEPPALNGDYLSGPRQDNLVSVHASLHAFLRYAASSQAREADFVAVFAAFDHEEVGSGTTSGAAGPILETVLQRCAISLGASPETYAQMLAGSICISADSGHSMNPNYAEKYDPDQYPVAGHGPMLKFNAQQRYASDAVSVTAVLQAARATGTPVQNFVSNNSVPCGTTIGPLTATRLGISTVDVGIPLLSMHSARELSHNADTYWLRRLIEGFWLGEAAREPAALTEVPENAAATNAPGVAGAEVSAGAAAGAAPEVAAGTPDPSVAATSAPAPAGEGQ